MFHTNGIARIAPLLVALAVILGAGLLHGVWTERWSPSQELDEAVARLDGLPERFGAWQAQPIDIDAKTLKQAGAAGHWLRRLTHARTGATVTILLLCGRTAQMAVHRPEHCYRGAGYEMSAPAAHQAVNFGDDRSAELWTARFVKDDPAGAGQLRIFWSWFADGTWRAPDSPRLAFAGLPLLFKLYAVRELTGPLQRVEDDPCLDLLRELLPEINKAISASSQPSSTP
jgi:hypothetical protein